MSIAEFRAAMHKSLTIEDANIKINELKISINQIINGNVSNLSFIDLYDAVYQLVTNNYDNMLFSTYTECIKTHLGELKNKLLNSKTNSDISREICIFWEGFSKNIPQLSGILMYLDRFYGVSKSSRVVLYSLFNTEILMQNNNRSIIIDECLVYIQDYRNGNDESLVKAKCLIEIITLFMKYNDSLFLSFHNNLIEDSKKYYLSISQKCNTINVSEYLVIVQRLYEREKNIQQMISSETTQVLEYNRTEIIITQKLDYILNVSLLIILGSNRNQVYTFS